MKRIWMPHLNRHIVVGAVRRPDPHAPAIRLKDYLDTAALPPSPATCDYSGPAMSVISNIEGNDSVGDCVLAEEAHFIAVMTGNAGTLYSYTAAQTLAAYSAITGYNPSDPSTDQGTDPIVDLNYWCQNAYADGSKNLGWALVDGTNQAEVQFAISAFGNLKVWLDLPDSYTSVSGNNFVWGATAPDPNNGHCVGSCGYDATGPNIITWGLLGRMTWPAMAALCVKLAGGGLAVRITPDWFNKATNQTPSGFAAADLISDFNKFFGGSVPVPQPPAPVPVPPGPAPTSPPTLAQATAAANAALAAAHPLLTRSQAEGIVAGALKPLWPSP